MGKGCSGTMGYRLNHTRVHTRKRASVLIHLFPAKKNDAFGYWSRPRATILIDGVTNMLSSWSGYFAKLLGANLRAMFCVFGAGRALHGSPSGPLFRPGKVVGSNFFNVSVFYVCRRPPAFLLWPREPGGVVYHGCKVLPLAYNVKK